MAWRIHESVIRGEIDNRERGRVGGKLWLHGIAGPVALQQTIPLSSPAGFNPLQRGSIGDLTASRKVRVFDIPFEEAYARLKKKLPVPEHLANCLYLEWFSEANGRVVVESADYKLTISPPAWRLSSEEEQQRQHEAAKGFTGFLWRLNEAMTGAERKPPGQEQDEPD